MTGNWIVTCFAMLTLFGIVSTILGSMALIGSTIGVLESICLSILVGISIDYVAHFCSAYISTPTALSRAKRAQGAFVHIGVSVLSGMITTVSSGLFLYVLFHFYRLSSLSLTT